MNTQFRVLITNDDGIFSDGILALITQLHKQNIDIRVFAPATQQSGLSHSITIWKPVYAEQYELPGEFKDIPAFVVDGTPADCVKVSLTGLSKGWRPHLVVSGINDGLNVGKSIIYSGTIGAAQEAVINGYPAIAFSLDRGYKTITKMEWESAGIFAANIIYWALNIEIPKGFFINVNFPNGGIYKGLKWTRQGSSGYNEYFVEVLQENSSEKTEPVNDKPKWKFHLTGKLELYDDSIEYDYYAVTENYVSLTPLGLFFSDRNYETVFEKLSNSKLPDVPISLLSQ